MAERGFNHRRNILNRNYVGGVEHWSMIISAFIKLKFKWGWRVLFDMFKDFNKRYPLIKWIFGLIIIGIPIIISILIWVIPFGIGDNNSWLSFWAVWLSAIIGSSVSITLL